MFASATKKTITVDDIAVVIQKLSARSLDKANEARQIAVGAVTKQLGAEFLRSIREDRKDQKDDAPVEKTPEQKRKERYASYDRETVLQMGVVEWDNPTPLREGLADLDENAATTLYEAILELSLPSEELVGKDSKPSISS